MKKFMMFFLVLVFGWSTLAVSGDVTHAIGTTNYMIREARLAGAMQKDKANYYNAIRLQKRAKKALRGTRKGGRNLELALQLTKEAYYFAKMARDHSDPKRYVPSKDLFELSLK